MLRLAYKRILLWGGSLIGLAAAIWFVYVMPPSHFMDMALTFITMFVGMSFIAALWIFVALLFYEIVVRAFTSDN